MGIRRGLKYLVFVISLCNARVLDPFLALLNPDFEGAAQDVNCQYLNEPRNKTMCDLHMELYFELLQKNFGQNSLLARSDLWCYQICQKSLYQKPYCQRVLEA